MGGRPHWGKEVVLSYIKGHKGNNSSQVDNI